MKKLKRIIVPPTCKISEAIKILQENDEKIVLVLKNNKLLGTVTDGDIRRALINKDDINLPVSTIMNSKPLKSQQHKDKNYFFELMTKNVIRHLPIVDQNNKLIDLEVLDQYFSQKKYDNWVLLMCGGRGKRLSPLTDNIPKPMINIGGKPILEVIIDNLTLQGFHNFFISVNYLKDQIKNYFGNGLAKGIRIEYIDEKKKLGTAGSIGLLKNINLKDPLLVMNGDILTKLNIAKLLNNHKKNKNFGTIVCQRIKNKLPYGEVFIKNNRVLKIEEKPESKHLINAGIYIFENEVVKFINNNQYLDMPELINNLINKNKKITFHINDKEWIDVGDKTNLTNATSIF